MTKKKVEFRNFCIKFGETCALNNLNYTVYENEFFVLFGPAGAGKTTTLKTIAGLEYGTTGEIFLNDKYANYLSPNERNTRMAFENYSLYPHLSVYRNLSSPLVTQKVPKNEIDNRVQKISNTLGITDYLNRLPKELSGGQKQRVALGRALIIESDIYLLDEPLAHLDAKIRNKLRAEFQNIKSYLSESTVIYVTHDYLEALSLGDRIGVIHDGKMLQIGDPKEIYNNPKNIYVAELFGQPEINLIEVEILKKNGEPILSKNGFTVNIPETYLSYVRSHLKKHLILGCRPQHWDFTFVEPNEDGYFKAHVAAFEVRNYRGVIMTQFDGEEVSILCESYENIRDNSTIWIKPNLENLFLFDPNTGENLKNYNGNGRKINGFNEH